MKFMKLGKHPDTFHTNEATRSANIPDMPTDLTIRINRITYLLHKSYLVPKCGLLQNKDDDCVDLDNVPGGEEAFELCAKFCYGIIINLSAHNFVPAFCAATFLQMTQQVEDGNFVTKLEAFFSSCILQGWKDSLVTLHSTERESELSENLGIVSRCIDSIVDKILTPLPEVTWSYTYTRPGYVRRSVPMDWWTEDLSSYLGIELFSSIITTISSTSVVQPQLIGEALHVYSHYWLLNVSESSPDTKRRILEALVSLIPQEKGSLSTKFLLRLLTTANSLGASPATKTQLLRLSGLQLDEATLHDLLLLTQPPDSTASHDIDLVKALVRSFLRHWKRQTETRSLQPIQKVGMLIDSYLQVVAKDVKMPAENMVSLIETIPPIARPQHDHLYKAIDIYLKEHPDLSKADKKVLCSFLDCEKLSAQVRSHAVKNERLPLRTLVQILFLEQEKSSSTATSLQASAIRDDLRQLKLSAAEEQSSKATGTSVSGEKPQVIQELKPEKKDKGKPSYNLRSDRSSQQSSNERV